MRLDSNERSFTEVELTLWQLSYRSCHRISRNCLFACFRFLYRFFSTNFLLLLLVCHSVYVVSLQLTDLTRDVAVFIRIMFFLLNAENSTYWYKVLTQKKYIRSGWSFTTLYYNILEIVVMKQHDVK